MSELFADKYLVKSTRLPEWDYSSAWWYYITVCVDKHKCFFGEVVHDEVKLNDIWKIVESVWLEIPDHFSNIELDEFVIMPNHLHGILYIVETSIYGVSNKRLDTMNNDLHAMNRVSTDASLQTINRASTVWWWVVWNKNVMLNKNSLWYVVRWFKWSVSFQINKNYPNLDFKWQPWFYEHIIRNDKDLERIREYIQNNPYKRKNDEYYV